MMHAFGLSTLVATAVVVALAAQQAAPTRTFKTAINLERTSEDSANVSMGDLDGDGDLDLVLAKGRHQPILDRVLLNDGKGVFTVAGTWGIATWSTRNAAVADLNGDGRPDVVAANRPGPSFACLNDGKGRFTSACIEIPSKSATSIVPADFDKDGFVDLAVPSRDGGQSRIYFNDGKAGFARTLPFGPPDAAARVGAAADFDGNGTIDLAVGDEAAASLVVYMNDGKGSLTSGFRVADPKKTPYAMTAGDLNNDRHPDIVLGYTAGPHAVFFNDGTGRTFTPVTFGDEKGSAYGFALGDINEDGFPDIALARSGAPNVLYLSGK